MSDDAERLANDAIQIAQRALRNVNTLEERIDDLEAENKRLRTLVAMDETRSDTVSGFDARDGAVMDALDARDETLFTVMEIRQLFRQETDIRRDETLTNRVKHLVTNGPFEEASRRRWHYLGRGGLDDE